VEIGGEPEWATLYYRRLPMLRVDYETRWIGGC
jgi:hypothetical protein